MAQTLFDKIWDQHKIKTLDGGEDLIAIDRVFLHERTGSVALKSMLDAGRAPIRPEHVFCTMDHIVSIQSERGENEARMPGGDNFITATREASQVAGINLIDVLSPEQGIVHVISPELGIVQPGMTLVCPDSHTCSQGALGALAWGIGSTDAEHAMVTGTLRVKKPKQMRISVNGNFRPGVSAKDLALYIIGKYGTAGGQRMAIEYAGSAIQSMSVEARLTLCNLAVEFAAFTAIIAPDETSFEYLKGRKYAPQDWVAAHEEWRALASDKAATFDVEYHIDAKDIPPMVSWGTSPEDVVSISGQVPKTDKQQALDYMGLKSGQEIESLKIGGAFIGSCTNARISDLRAAAAILKGQRVDPSVRAICVPGSTQVRRQAEAEGLDQIFKSAGFEWGSAGCALCFYAGGDTFAPGTRVISSTNRNFKGRQGPNVRTHLASPVIVAASAIKGRISMPARGAGGHNV